MENAMSERLVTDFVIESNRIEGIRGARSVEVEATMRFIEAGPPTVGTLSTLALVFAPDKGYLRSRTGMDVRVGNHIPIRGGERVPYKLDALLRSIEGADPYLFHCAYETLHPFMDGNGRTGRALWAWQMVRYLPPMAAPMPGTPRPLDWHALHLGFLHRFYYQALQGARL